MKATIKRNIEISVQMDGQQIADAFWQLNETEQASFFNKLWDLAAENVGGFYNFQMQMQYVTDNGGLNHRGREVMKTIGEYSEKPVAA